MMIHCRVAHHSVYLTLMVLFAQTPMIYLPLVLAHVVRQNDHFGVFPYEPVKKVTTSPFLRDPIGSVIMVNGTL